MREALSLLQLQGMVTIIPQNGTYVFLPTEQDIIDVCEYRIVIELSAVSFALARRRDPTLALLRRRLRSCRKRAAAPIP